MKIKIVSKGTGATTKILNAETGEVVEGVSTAEWKVDAGGRATAKLTFVMVPVEIEGETE